MVMENVEASHQLLVIVNQSAGISIMTATYRYSLLWNLGLAQIAIELVSLLLACRLWANHAVSRVSAWNRSLHNLLDEIKGLCELAEASFIDNHPFSNLCVCCRLGPTPAEGGTEASLQKHQHGK